MDTNSPHESFKDHDDAARAAASLSNHWISKAKAATNLHDFRTSLRRLRVILSAYRKLLGPVASKGMRRRLKHLSRSTGAWRNTEVWADWPADPLKIQLWHCFAPDGKMKTKRI